MNSPLPWSEASAPTHCDGLSATARANRALLIEALSGAGLTNVRDRIETAGMGEQNPVADNATEEGRAKNRRTELVIVKR